MNKRSLIISGVLVLVVMLLVTTLISWLTTYNGAQRRLRAIDFEETKIYSAFNNRLEKQENLLSYVNTADEQILNQLGLITSAREAFSEAFKNHDEQESFENFQTIETTFLGLLSYLEDNPNNWTSIGLTSKLIDEFNATTNALTYAIDNYNKSRYDYNLFIVLFPQKLFLNKFTENNRVFIQPAPSIDEAFKSE